jgi:hypothetical protein
MMTDELLSDERLAEIEMLAKSDAYASEADILGVDELIAEVRRLRDVIRDVVAAPRHYLPDPRHPGSSVMSWAVIPREFMDKLEGPED